MLELSDLMARQFLSVALVAFLTAACAQEVPAPKPLRGADILLPIETQIIEALVPRNATLDGLLREHELPMELVHAAVESARLVFDPRDLRANRPYRLVRSLDGFLREFEYQIDADRFLRIISPDRSSPAVLQAQVLPYEKDTSVLAIRGRIDSDRPSLIAAMEATGENITLAIDLAELFSGQIDFQSDLQPGDTFDVVFEKSMRDGQFSNYGAILGARFTNEGREYQAYRWVHPTTKRAGYYDHEGRSLRRAMLKSPLKFDARLSSGFSRRRLHPVHRTYRPHLGVDYAAPIGSHVVAVADGVVVSAAWAGGGGRQVRLRHRGGLESYYLHLSSFAKGIRAGARVDQGQLIGRVGATGTATGPHLDYRLRRNGVFVDPRREHARQPPGDPIPAVHLVSYRTARNGVLRQLSTTVLAEAPAAKADAVKAIQ
jgi:murein DD-endopeptidase MepM/ murein hydrolase activator NlpD